MAAILLIHDDELVRIATRMMLERAGHQVHDTDDGQRGIRRLQSLGADLVIAKSNMEFTSTAIRQADPSVPILLTCPPEGLSKSEAREAAQVGAEMVSSPFSAPDLIGEVGRMLEAKQG